MQARWIDLGTMDYADCWQLQQRLFDELLAAKQLRGANRTGPDRMEHKPDQTEQPGPNQTGPDRMEHKPDQTEQPGPEQGARKSPPEGIGTILLVEHPPVYTLGKSGRAENLLVDPDRLAQWGATFFRIDRGGDITFHGPGQLVCYPVLDLEPLGMGLRDYIEALEECVIRTAADYGVAGGRIAGASGVWIDPAGRTPRKLCAVGVRSSRYVTMHGFALNVTTDLRWFSRIHPCGFTDRGVCSLATETGTQPAMAAVKQRVLQHLAEVLGVEWVAGA